MGLFLFDTLSPFPYAYVLTGNVGLFLFDTLSPFPYVYVLTGNVDPLQGGTKVSPIHGANHLYREKLFFVVFLYIANEILYIPADFFFFFWTIFFLYKDS